MKAYFTLLLFLIGTSLFTKGDEKHLHGTKLLQAEKPFSRATNGKNGAAFMTLHNHSQTPIKLIKATTSIAKTTELHTHIKEGDVFRMRPVPAIEIPANGSAILKPGGLHIMFLGLHHPLKEKDSFDLTLEFDNGTLLTLPVPIKKAGHMGCGCKHH